MTDVLAQIDATLEACTTPCFRCGQPLSARSPSQDFCSKRCGVWWYGSDLDRMEAGLPIPSTNPLTAEDVARLYGVPPFLVAPVSPVQAEVNRLSPIMAFGRAYLDLVVSPDPFSALRAITITPC